MMGSTTALLRAAFCCAVLGWVTDATEASPALPTPIKAIEAVVEQPRPFGYLVGDLLTQRVLLEAQGRTFEPAGLPRPERIGVWLERRTPHVEPDTEGRRWLVVDYQVINAPQVPTQISVPEWELPAQSGSPALKIAAWPFSVSALTPRTALAQGGVEQLRPDRPAPVVATAPIRRQILAWSAAGMGALVAWLSWWLWRNWRASMRQPFARALREMRGLVETSPEAWQALHRGFDRTAGRVMQSGNLDRLFAQAPHFSPLRERVEIFYRQSGELFFGGGLSADPISVRTLCAELRRVEKRHER